MVAVTSGANMNFDRLRLVTELADLGANVGIPASLSSWKARCGLMSKDWCWASCCLMQVALQLPCYRHVNTCR